MSKHTAERGTKRTCQGCGARFYDLNRDPITCPLCSAVFQLEAPPVGRGEAAAIALAAEKARKAPKKPEPVASEELPDGTDLPEEAVAEDIAVEAEEPAAEGEEETFLPEEEEDTDVTGFIDAGIEEGGEEES
jgi:uncharacterized protein (TIGR02300 family)